MDLHILADSRFQAHATVSCHALQRAKDPIDLVGMTVRDLAQQMSEHIVRKRIESIQNLREDSITYRMDLYVVTPEELAALVEERAQKLLASPGAHFIRTQDHVR